MKFGLMIYEARYDLINIGDYIQSLAAKQFVNNNKLVLISREHLDTYHGEELCVILNGWFMHYPKNFPPSDSIIPIFISFHLNKSIKNTFLTNSTIEYLKHHEPIGCRDLYTLDILSKHGIQAYFSGCLTLTLGNTYQQTSKRENIYFIDPYIGKRKDILNIFFAIQCFIYNVHKIYKIAKIKYKKINILTLLYSSIFYRQYSNFWSDDILFNAQYIDHYIKPSTEEENFKYADELLKNYANAKLIITSKIHAALPATGMNTPCIFILPQNLRDVELCRFSGLLNIFNVMYHTGYTIKNKDYINILSPEIKQNYSPVKSELIKILTKKLFEYDS
jgi:hypothetical protein